MDAVMILISQMTNTCFDLELSFLIVESPMNDDFALL